jgi:hypothetical protein
MADTDDAAAETKFIAMLDKWADARDVKKAAEKEEADKKAAEEAEKARAATPASFISTFLGLNK